jgi:hypothetical protein
MPDPETKASSSKTTYINVPEAVGVFDTFAAQQAAFYDLRSVGFHHSDISLLGSQEALEERLGKAYWRASALEDDPDAPRANFVSEEAIGELEGAIAGGFFFVGSAIAMAALLTPASTLAALSPPSPLAVVLPPSLGRCSPGGLGNATRITTRARSVMAVS